MSGTILLADDSLTIQKVVELTFADTNYRVVAVSSGDELLDRLGDSQPDLIICDVIMPGRDGYEVCQQIKSSSEWLHLPVILLTGTFEPFDRDRAIAAGCSEIITKPFEARKLVDTVERLIGGRATKAPEPAFDGPAAANEGETWPEEATPVGIPLEAEDEDFGTQLSAPEREADGIEFTTSGFAEMEAAGRKPRTPPAATGADDGLEYEFDGPHAGDFEEPTPSFSPPPPPIDTSAQTVRIDLTAIADIAEPADHASPFDAFQGSADDHFGAGEVDVPPEAVAEAVPEPFTPLDDEPFEAVAEEVVKKTFRDEPSMADTSPVDPPRADTGPVEEPQGNAAIQLTEDDIDRIARRVIELASDRLEQIAWDIVPDMAEIVVRQRIRELEADTESSTPDPVQ